MKKNTPLKATLLFAHGAGADSSSPFMQFMQRHITHDAIRVRSFNFPYMQQRLLTGKKSPPNRMPQLIAAFREEINQIDDDSLIIVGGKSMGGRVASMLMAEQDQAPTQTNAKISGLVCMGYPFHPPQKPDNLRTEHLYQITTPSLILHGTRDPFGKPNEVESYQLPNSIRVQWLEDGNHSFETLKRSTLATQQTWHQAAMLTQRYILELMKHCFQV